MSPAENKNNLIVVSWDLDTTGRRLIDEICQVAGFYEYDKEEFPFSQYTMPHKNPNPGARRSFGIKVASMGRYRMLKDVETGKILKTKSEVSALQDFISWLKEAKERAKAEGVILVCHEPARKVLIPLFLEALRRYNLLDSFKDVVVSFANSVKVVEKFADSEKVTSYSLRSLCKTILGNTNPATASACDRAKILVEILSKILHNNIDNNKEETTTASHVIDPVKVLSVGTTVQDELLEVQNLKSVLATQGTLRPIFENQLKQKRAVREHAIGLRKLVAEAGLKYEDLEALYKNNETSNATNEESRCNSLKDKISDAGDKDVKELIKLLDKHFIKKQQPTSNHHVTNHVTVSSTPSNTEAAVKSEAK